MLQDRHHEVRDKEVQRACTAFQDSLIRRKKEIKHTLGAQDDVTNMMNEATIAKYNGGFAELDAKLQAFKAALANSPLAAEALTHILVCLCL